MKAMIGMVTGVLLLAGCSSTTEEQLEDGYSRTLNAAGEVTHICRSEQTVGTNFKKRSCRSLKQLEQDREDAQDFMQYYQGQMLTPVVN
jgi:protein involved in sex pheromone biosynthesis